jgi:hypothetical protein
MSRQCKPKLPGTAGWIDTDDRLARGQNEPFDTQAIGSDRGRSH